MALLIAPWSPVVKPARQPVRPGSRAILSRVPGARVPQPPRRLADLPDHTAPARADARRAGPCRTVSRTDPNRFGAAPQVYGDPRCSWRILACTADRQRSTAGRTVAPAPLRPPAFTGLCVARQKGERTRQLRSEPSQKTKGVRGRYPERRCNGIALRALRQEPLEERQATPRTEALRSLGRRERDGRRRPVFDPPAIVGETHGAVSVQRKAADRRPGPPDGQ